MSYRTLASVAAVLLVVALAELPYGYYTLLRIVVCGVSAYGAFIAYGVQTEGWTLVLGMTALVFNPLIPIHLEREVWSIVDLVTAGVLFASGLTLPRRLAKTENTKDSS